MRNVNNNYASCGNRLGTCPASVLFGHTCDTIGNRITATTNEVETEYTANLLNQYTAIDQEAPTYDFDGNMLTNGGWTYTWNIENRLASAESALVKLEFLYDYLGRRTTKKIYTKTGTTWTLQTTKTFVYDGFKQIAELTDNAVTMYTVWQPTSSGDEDVPLWTKGNTVHTCIVDGNKNIRQLKDATGTVVASYDYDPFGNVTATGTTIPWQFSSEYRDEENGLVYYNYRHYSPDLGRWLNRDPIGEGGGPNLYGMGSNNLVHFWDYLGFAIESACNLDEYLTQKNVTDFSWTMKKGRKYLYEGRGTDDKRRPNYAAGDVESEILAKMIRSRYVFVLNDETITSVNALASHVAARMQIIENAKGFRLLFGASDEAKGIQSLPPKEPSESWQEYYDRLHREHDNLAKQSLETQGTSGGYAVYCLLATRLISNTAGERWKRYDSIFIPGDWGYIDNTSHDPKYWNTGHEGENIIYLGGDQYWGHINGRNIFSLEEWIEIVNSFRPRSPGGGKANAVLEDYRLYPLAGLKW